MWCSKVKQFGQTSMQFARGAEVQGITFPLMLSIITAESLFYWVITVIFFIYFYCFNLGEIRKLQWIWSLTKWCVKLSVYSTKLCLISCSNIISQNSRQWFACESIINVRSKSNAIVICSRFMIFISQYIL